MGWSCTKKAGDTLDRLVQYYLEKGETSQNTFGKGQYFWETGRENRDGAITGRVGKFTGPVQTNTPADGSTPYQFQPAVVVGSFRIDPNGTIKRFPGLPTEVKKYLNALTTEAFVVIP